MTTENLTTKEHTEAHGDKIKGYRKLSDDEINKINMVKKAGNDLDELIAIIGGNSGIPEQDADPRWLAMARTDLQVGIMKLVRSIAKPAGF